MGWVQLQSHLLNFLHFSHRVEFKEWCKKFKFFSDKIGWLEKKGLLKKRDQKECFQVYFFGIYTIYRLIFLACSLLGLLSGYFYFLCLPYIFIKVDVIELVVKAVGGACKLMSYLHYVVSFTLQVSQYFLLYFLFWVLYWFMLLCLLLLFLTFLILNLVATCSVIHFFNVILQ